MALKIIVPPPPPDDFLSLKDFRCHAGQGGPTTPAPSEDDPVVRLIIRAVQSWLAGPNGWLGRSLLTQTLELTVPLETATGFVGPEIRHGLSGVPLPRPPFIEVLSVAVLDATDEATAIDPPAWTTREEGDGLTHLYFTPLFRAPVIAHGPARLRIQYRAGYGTSAGDVDPAIRQAGLMACMRLYAGRGDPTVSLQTDPFMRELFAPYRVGSSGVAF